MNTNPLHKSILTDDSVGIGRVTPEMVLSRARELALMAGRFTAHVSLLDYAQAKRELTGGPEIDPQEALFQSVPDGRGWDTVPGVNRHRAPESPGETGHDQMQTLQDAKAARKKN